MGQVHRVKVEVTGAKNVENLYSRNVKLRWVVSLLLQNIEL